MVRRKFIRQSALSSMALALSTNFGLGNHPLVGKYSNLVQVNDGLPGKHPLMTVLNDRPINAETPPHLLNDTLTPNNLFFVRNNGIPPASVQKNEWTLTIDGEAARSKKVYKIADLKQRFAEYSYQITLECGGNGRKEFNPPAKGNQWSTGAVGCAQWTGVRLKDVLEDVGIKDNAVYIGYYGADTHLSGDPKKVPISRGVPIEKAMEAECLIAWSMNGEALPELNGYPLRLVFGGYPASASGKWLKQIVVRNKIHDGAKMGGQSYRIPCKSVAPGTKVADSEMCIIERMPVKSLITSPKTGATISADQKIPLAGHAWTSASKITAVDYSIDFGMTWNSCKVSPGANRFAWQRFEAEVGFPANGYYEVWARATDSDGFTQPIILPGWNPKGYLNNACHRIAIKVES